MRKYIWLFIPLLLSANEPSAFDAGNLNIENPYGLTESEKQILANKQNTAKLKQRLEEQRMRTSRLQRELKEQTQKIQGLVSVVEGVNQGNFDKISTLEQKVSKLENNNSVLSGKISKLQNAQQAAAKNDGKFRRAIEQINDILSRINKEYVDKERFRKLEEAFFELEKAVAGNSVRDFGGDNWATYEQMQKLYDQGKLDEALARAQYLVKENYKKATANYYLGQIYYAKQQYEDAVYHYKESWSIYDKSDFMPTLLLKTAEALHKLGRESEAKNFFRAVLDQYPETNQAKQANQQLKEL